MVEWSVPAAVYTCHGIEAVRPCSQKAQFALEGYLQQLKTKQNKSELEIIENKKIQIFIWEMIKNKENTTKKKKTRNTKNH